MTVLSRITPRYLTSNALSLLGNTVAAVALPLVLLATTGDALAAGTLAIICAIPQMIIGMIGGAVLDRFNRRDISILSDLLSATSIALIPVVDMIWGLNFGWFVALGLLGAIGDIPGMTARDALLPAVTEHDGTSLQKFMGLTQSLDSLTAIIGPALAAFFIGLVGGVSSLWFTAAMSFAAALVTLSLPRSIGSIRTSAESAQEAEPLRNLMSAGIGALRTGLHVLFRQDKLLSSATVLTFGIIMVMGSFQGLVLPVYFTASDSPQMLGYVLSAMSAGMLISSLGYAALATRLRRRTWYVVSLAGMIVGVGIMGTLSSFPVLLAGALVLGFAAGPASALLGFFVFDRIPEESRGSALGTQNSLMLVVTPAAVFVTSIAVETLGMNVAAWILVGCWLVVSIWALATKSMRDLGDAPCGVAGDSAIAVQEGEIAPAAPLAK